MKIYKALSLIVGMLALLLAACEPIEDRQVLTNSFNPDDIELKVVQSTPGGNELSIQMNTPGVAGYWDFVIDRKYSDRVDVIYPIPGTSTFTFHVTTPYLEDGNINHLDFNISKSIDVTITQLDHELPPAYYKLVGDNLEGKTWVFDGVDEAGKLWWYMVAGYNWQEFWWNAGQDAPPSDRYGRMVFDLDGGANYTYYSGPDADPVTGSTWAFNSDFTKLTIKGPAQLLGAYPGSGGGNAGVYQIKEFTADHLLLFVPDAEWATGWIWIFKPAD